MNNKAVESTPPDHPTAIWLGRDVAKLEVFNQFFACGIIGGVIV